MSEKVSLIIFAVWLDFLIFLTIISASPLLLVIAASQTFVTYVAFYIILSRIRERNRLEGRIFLGRPTVDYM